MKLRSYRTYLTAIVVIIAAIYILLFSAFVDTPYSSQKIFFLLLIPFLLLINWAIFFFSASFQKDESVIAFITPVVVSDVIYTALSLFLGIILKSFFTDNVQSKFLGFFFLPVPVPSSFVSKRKGLPLPTTGSMPSSRKPGPSGPRPGKSSSTLPWPSASSRRSGAKTSSSSPTAAGRGCFPATTSSGLGCRSAS